MLLPRLPAAAAQIIVATRPFADEADFLARVNAHAANPRQCIGHKMVKYFTFQPACGAARLARTRNADYARELLGLFVQVPWSAWEGYEARSGTQRGMVWDYNRDTKRFTICFAPEADWDCDDIGLTWQELLGVHISSASTAPQCSIVLLMCYVDKHRLMNMSNRASWVAGSAPAGG